jgi:hypothetical protein
MTNPAPLAGDHAPPVSILDVFPRRPLKLAYLPSVRTGWWELAGILLFVGGLIADLLYIPPSIIDDLAIGGSGTVAQQAGIAEGGKCNVKAFVMICDFDVNYRTADGAARQKSLHYLAFGTGMDDLDRLQVRYDSANPDRISTNWGRDMLINRIIAEIIALVLLIVFVGAVVLSYLSTFTRRRSLRAMAGDPRPVVADFVRVAPSKQFATVHFTWTDPGTKARHRDSTRLPGRTEPFWLDGQRKTMLALAGPDGRAHLLDQTLGPVVLTDEERAALSRARAGSVPPGASAAG